MSQLLERRVYPPGLWGFYDTHTHTLTHHSQPASIHSHTRQVTVGEKQTNRKLTDSASLPSTTHTHTNHTHNTHTQTTHTSRRRAAADMSKTHKGYDAC